MGTNLVKQDINFFEYPLWFQDGQMAERNEEGFIWKDREGFLYRDGYKPPVKVDMIFLLYLLLRSQQEKWQEKIELSRYEVLRDCQVGTSAYWYERLEESLTRWKMVGVEFQGTFYDGKEYLSLIFGIIDSWGLEKKSKSLWVRFSPEWLIRIKESNYFKLVDFEQLKALRSSLATRLYEVLIKTFQGRSKWEIDSLKLAAKIPMDEKYPAHIIPKIKAAVNRIAEHTEFQVDLEVRRPRRGKAIFVFHQRPGTESTIGPNILDVPEEKQEALERLLQLVREEERSKKTVLEIISRALRKQNEGYVRRNIEYANVNAERNYRGFLSKALKKDWATEEVQKEREASQHLQQSPSSQQQAERREPTEDEIETAFQESLKQMDTVDVELRINRARIELAKERVKSEPSIHPDHISHQDAQKRLLSTLRKEIQSYLTHSS